MSRFDPLIADFKAFGRTLPQSLRDLDAEALLHEDLTPPQRAWVSAFIKQWEAVEQVEADERKAWSEAEAQQWLGEG